MTNERILIATSTVLDRLKVNHTKERIKFMFQTTIKVVNFIKYC